MKDLRLETLLILNKISLECNLTIIIVREVERKVNSQQ